MSGLWALLALLAIGFGTLIGMALVYSLCYLAVYWQMPAWS